MAIRWIFFDVGDVLFDETVPHLYYYHSMLLAMRRNGVDVSYDEYAERIHQCARVKPTTSVTDALRAFIPSDALCAKVEQEGRVEYQEMRKPRPYGLLLDGITPILKRLRLEYRLGIVANQHPPVTDALRDYGIAPLFDVTIIDEIVGVSKPDPAIFQLALSEAGCSAAEAIMVGDRADHDVRPAKALGMATIRFRRGMHYVWYDGRGEDEQADVEVRETSRLQDAVLALSAKKSMT